MQDPCMEINILIIGVIHDLFEASFGLFWYLTTGLQAWLFVQAMTFEGNALIHAINAV